MLTPEGEEQERILPHDAASAEEIALAREARQQRETAFDALAAALAGLPEQARTYLHLRFMAEPPLPPRQIARQLGVAVDELYRKRRQWEDLLRSELHKRGITKFPEPSV